MGNDTQEESLGSDQNLGRSSLCEDDTDDLLCGLEQCLVGVSNAGPHTRQVTPSARTPQGQGALRRPDSASGPQTRCMSESVCLRRHVCISVKMFQRQEGKLAAETFGRRWNSKILENPGMSTSNSLHAQGLLGGKDNPVRTLRVTVAHPCPSLRTSMN